MNFNRTAESFNLPDWSGVGPMPRLLLHPNIPRPLHGLAPRVLIGGKWWAEAKQAAYLAYRNTCWACGVPKNKAPFHRWLEAHEIYDVDWQRGRSYFRGTCALCVPCHAFIHDGRMAMLVSKGQMTVDRWAAVMLWGEGVLHRAGIVERKRREPVNGVPWGDWRLVIGTREFKPQFASEAEYEAHWKDK